MVPKTTTTPLQLRLHLLVKLHLIMYDFGTAHSEFVIYLQRCILNSELNIEHVPVGLGTYNTNTSGCTNIVRTTYHNSQKNIQPLYRDF